MSESIGDNLMRFAQIAGGPRDQPAVAPMSIGAAQAPSMAEAWTGNAQAIQQMLERQRAISAQRGLWNDQTGLPTGAGAVDAAQQYAGGVLMGSTAPGGKGFTAYHGSPHDFDRFDASKIGTGEGAQAYGHGMPYLAGNESVARGYRDALAPRTYQTIDGKPEGYSDIWKALHAAQTGEGVHPNIAPKVASHVLDMIDEAGSIEKAVKGYDIPNDPRFGPAYEAAIESAQRMGLKTNKGHMYEVQVNADPAHFLDWDKPLSEQSPYVQQALAGQGPNSVGGYNVRPVENGHVVDYRSADGSWRTSAVFKDEGQATRAGRATQEILQDGLKDWVAAHARKLGGEYNVSAQHAQMLKQAGIPGIRYLDQGSRASGEGTHNTVMFDASLVEILRKYLALGMLGGGAAAGAAPAPQHDTDAPWVQNLKRLVQPGIDPHGLIAPQYQNTDPGLNRTGPRIGEMPQS